jgi:hypothetical protein
MAVQLLCVLEQEQDVSENKVNGDCISCLKTSQGLGKKLFQLCHFLLMCMYQARKVRGRVCALRLSTLTLLETVRTLWYFFIFIFFYYTLFCNCLF